MIARVLLIDDPVIARVAQVRAHALLHRETLSDLMRRMNQPSECPGNDPNFTVELFDGWKIVYTIEQQPDPLGWVIHLSVSVRSTGNSARWPNPVAVESGILPLFKLKMKDAAYIYKENVAPVGENRIAAAVNFLFKYPGPLP